MRLAHVLRDYVARALIYNLLTAYDLDALAAARSERLHDEHILVIARLSVDTPAFVIFGENIRRWRNIERFAVQAAHPLNVPPH